MSREFSNKLQTCFNQQARRFKNNQDGYIFILMCCLIPVILLGTKLVLDTSTENASKLHIYKKCAREAALKVAQHWNPGLTYDQQKWAVLKLADDVYNASPAYGRGASAKYDAVPGLDVPTKLKVTQKGKYDPLKVETVATEMVSLSPSAKTIPYESAIGNFERIGSYSTNGCDEALRAAESAYMSVYLMNKSPYFVLEDTIKDCAIQRTSSSTNENKFYSTLRSLNKSFFTSNCSVYSSSTISGTLSKRVNESDEAVNIAVNQNKIRVMTDEDVAYAVPAECNIDIVLGIPANGAACNADNRDSHTTTVGTSYYQTVTDPQSTAKTTPIYQIAQAFRTFIKNNFYYTRGTNVGLVPYSGNLSIPSNRISSWTAFHNNFESSYFLSDQNAYPAFFRSCYTYGIGNTNPLSSGIFSNTSVYKGAIGCDYSGLNIMRRLGKFWQDTSGGYNYIYEGDLLSTANPATSDSGTYSYKFGYTSLRYVPYRNSLNYLNFCFQYYFDLTTLTANYGTFLTVNPYHIAELQSDLLKVTDLLNCMYPVKYIGNSESNFIFLPVTWANNLFQSWTNDPGYNSTTSTTTLYRQPKTTSDRKKAVIIVVNKPDWFEPNELTYLGYDNDSSEIPMFESDAIDFSRDYSSTSGGHFADGSSYDGTIQGQKKILKFTGTNVSRNTDTGYYECTGTGSATLSFPKKYLVKVVVETPKITFSKVNTIIPQRGTFNVLNWGDNQFMAATGGYVDLYTSSDGVNWVRKSRIDSSGMTAILPVLIFSNGYYMISTRDNGHIRVSENLSTWINIGQNGTKDIISGCALSDRALLCNKTGYLTYSTDGGSNWISMGQKLNNLHTSSGEDIAGISYGKDKILAVTKSGWISTSFDQGQNWSTPNQNLRSLYEKSGNSSIVQSNFGEGLFFVMTENCWLTTSSDGINWSVPEQLIDNVSASCVAYGYNIGWCIITYNGDIYLQNRNSSITFNNLINVKNPQVLVSDQQTIYIEPSQMSGTTITFNMTNIRLISAEITNYPYEIITSADGTRTVNVLGQPRAADNRNLNTALYYGTSGSTTHSFAWQSATDGTWHGTSSTDGLKNVAVSAIKKLFNEEGGSAGNLRIYFILYRRQTKYKNPSTGSETEFDYKYLTGLAANSSLTGTTAASAEYPIYKCIDVSDEAGLTSTLSSIASELKIWAGYKAAEVVE